MPEEMDKISYTASGQGTWSDVTKEFRAAAKELELGELLHDETFGLFEAMSAIEMMDPKMDAGMSMCSREFAPPQSFDDLVEVSEKVRLKLARK